MTGSCGLPRSRATGAHRRRYGRHRMPWRWARSRPASPRLAMMANSTIMNSTRLSSMTSTRSPGFRPCREIAGEALAAVEQLAPGDGGPSSMMIAGRSGSSRQPWRRSRSPICCGTARPVGRDVLVLIQAAGRSGTLARPSSMRCDASAALIGPPRRNRSGSPGFHPCRRLRSRRPRRKRSSARL